MAKFYSIHAFSKILGVTPQTLRNWDRAGKLKPHHTAANGHRYYSQEQLESITDAQKEKRITIGYCRVSSHKQKDDLNRQCENMRAYLLAQGRPFKIIQDIGSGINYRNKGLIELIKLINDNRADKVVILYKDRLLRFGAELVEEFASLHNCEIEIIDHEEKTEQQELVEDLIQIITVFSCKLQGKHAHKAKKLIQELASNGDDDD
ncbi:MAG: IS607 family transposase [Synergistaceae bacterium]|nr:IS607 family transposase [Synergistaceae bacterium]MBQ7220003.1 IS607 family transposase [Synergistaceae bacterium]